MNFEQYLEKINLIVGNFPNFEVEILSKDGVAVVKIKSKSIDNKIDLAIAGGVHGEEIAGSMAIIENLHEILREAEEKNIKILVYPIVNFFGLERRERFNADGISCNSFWIHEDGIMAIESQLVKDNISQYRVNYFISLHEDGEIEEQKFYLYNFGDIEVAKRLVEVASTEIPAFETGFHGTAGEDKIMNGMIYDEHDGTFEDFMYHQGAKASICTETPLKMDLQKRIAINNKWIKEIIKIAAK